MLTPPSRGPMPSGTAAKSNEADPNAIRSHLQMIINSTLRSNGCPGNRRNSNGFPPGSPDARPGDCLTAG
jgi:hypothetical protein